MQEENVRTYLEKKLDKKRIAHSVGTANVASTLADKHNADTQKAYLAGLLHDIAKGICGDELDRLLNTYGIVADDTEQQNPELLHGRLGAAMVRDELGIADEDILNAIRWHTTGRAGMSLLEKIIYLADLIEPTRNFEGICDIRALSEDDIDVAMCAALTQVMDFVRRKGFALHPNSLMAYNDCIKGGKTQFETPTQ